MNRIIPTSPYRAATACLAALLCALAFSAAAQTSQPDTTAAQLPDYEVEGREDILGAPDRNLKRLKETLPDLGEEGPVLDEDGNPVLDALGLTGDTIQDKPEEDQQRAVQFLERMQDPDPIN